MGWASNLARLLILALLIAGSPTYAQSCDEEELSKGLRVVTEAGNADLGELAIARADSILAAFPQKRGAVCSTRLEILFQKGNALELANLMEDALILYYDLVRSARAGELWQLSAETYLSIARTHEVLGRPENCLRYLNEARNLIKQHDLKGTYSRFGVRYASYHRIYDNRDSAKYYARIGVEYGKLYQRERSELDGNLLMGILSDTTTEASTFFQAAAAIYKERGSYDGIATQYNNLASRFLMVREIDSAKFWSDSAFFYASQFEPSTPEQYYTMSRLYDLRRMIYYRNGNIDSAYRYLDLSRVAERQSNTIRSQENIDERETAFAIEQEQQKLALVRERERLLRIGLILGVAVSALLALLLINNYRRRRQISQQSSLIANQNIELSASINRQKTLLHEIHHRVKNNLQLIISMLVLQGRQSDVANTRIQLEQMSNRVRSISLIHEQLYQTKDLEDLHLPTYFDRLANHFSSLPSDNKQFVFKQDIPDIKLNLETTMPLGLICAELMGNSIKYAHTKDGEPLTLWLSVVQQKPKDTHGKTYLLTYRDNGPGYPEGSLLKQTSSMGSILISSMLRQLQAIGESYNDQGAVFEVHFEEKVVSGA